MLSPRLDSPIGEACESLDDSPSSVLVFFEPNDHFPLIRELRKEGIAVCDTKA
jgi:hypothetical protein